jgi:integrase/recombinase XerD
MARIAKRKTQPPPQTPLELLQQEYLKALQVKNFSDYTVRSRRVALRNFIQWAQERGLSQPLEITRPVVERYQRHLFHARKKSGEPLSFRTQHCYLIPLRVWFKWMTRQNYILHNPASELELPRLVRTLPKNIPSPQQVEQIMTQPDIREAIGLRDRAMLELLYSSGPRRLELINLKLSDLSLDRGLMFIREGKGKRDRYVPITERAVIWTEKYIREARPQLAMEPDDLTLFLTAEGEPFSLNHLSTSVRAHVVKAEIGMTGACHMLRHAMATHMLEGGADIRYIQQMLGHQDLKSTQIYTHVALRALQQIHAATHPAAFLDPAKAAKQRKEAPADPGAVELMAALDRDAEEDREE